MPNSIKVQLLLTGNEIMSGVTSDTNSTRMAHALSTLGISIHRKVTVGDDITLLIEALQNQSQNSNVLIVNGGLGPTVDDLSVEAAAKAFDLSIKKHPDAFSHVQNWCKRIHAELNQANLKQSYLPEGADILANSIGSAVGFSLVQNNCLILFTPGVPSELEAMLDNAILPKLKVKFPNITQAYIERLHFFGIGESRFQQTVDDKITDWPEEVTLSFRAGSPTLEVKLTSFHKSHASIKDACRKQLFNLFGDYFITEGNSTLAEALVKLLKENNKRITFAESCTGGKMASLLTEVSGASQVFDAGFVSYSNTIKNQLLNVKLETIEQHGAVSEKVVNEMLLGALKLSQADYGIAVSGIAGPDGGSDEKPIGTVCFAWGSPNDYQSCTFLMPRSRKMFQLMVAATGFDLIRRKICNIEEAPIYFGRKRLS